MRRRWRRPGRSSWWPVVIMALIALLVLLLWEWRLRPAMEAVAVSQAHWVANEAIQEAVLAHLDGQVNYNNLIQPGTDASGQVVFMQADALTISRLQAEIRLAIETSLARLRGRTYYLPLGQVIGMKLLAAYGPPVPLRFIPMGIVEMELGDTFEATGINQTRHSIFFQVESVIRVVAPFSQEQVRVAATIPVAEAIIVGPVPQTYISLGSELIKGILHAPSF